MSVNEGVRGVAKVPLVLSLFPGIGLLDMAFEEEGFCVVRGPDVLWGGDIRRFHPPAGKFDGVIGGPPCQAFSRLAHMVRQNGYEPKFGNLIPEYERCVYEAAPRWFVMEEVPDAPVPAVRGYNVDARFLNNRWLGEVANRLRRISFGVRADTLHWRVLPIECEALMSAEFEHAATGGSQFDGTGKRPKGSRLPWNAKTEKAFREVCRKQGLPGDFDLPPFTVSAKCQAVGNGVPLAMGRAIVSRLARRGECVMSWTDPFLINPVGRPKKLLQQPQAPTSEMVKLSPSWWAIAPREKFTQRAEAERQRMGNDVIGRKVPDQIMGKYIGLLRPAE